jgi:hypothetical protein
MGRFPGKVCYCGYQQRLSSQEEPAFWCTAYAFKSAGITHTEAEMCEGHKEPAIIFKASWALPGRILGFSFKMITYGQFVEKHGN